jgi:hypothetical protein
MWSKNEPFALSAAFRCEKPTFELLADSAAGGSGATAPGGDLAVDTAQ